jgi:hypothetical protein
MTGGRRSCGREPGRNPEQLIQCSPSCGRSAPETASRSIRQGSAGRFPERAPHGCQGGEASATSPQMSAASNRPSVCASSKPAINISARVSSSNTRSIIASTMRRRQSARCSGAGVSLIWRASCARSARNPQPTARTSAKSSARGCGQSGPTGARPASPATARPTNRRHGRAKRSIAKAFGQSDRSRHGDHDAQASHVLDCSSGGGLCGVVAGLRAGQLESVASPFPIARKTDPREPDQQHRQNARVSRATFHPVCNAPRRARTLGI